MGEQVAAGINGGVAQLGEHLPCKQGVKGSNPFISTLIMKRVILRMKTRTRGRLRTKVRADSDERGHSKNVRDEQDAKHLRIGSHILHQ